MENMRLMGIDYGEKRIGLALSDPMQIISTPYQVLSNEKGIFDKLREIIENEKVGKIILGLPLNLAGEDSRKTKEVRTFKQQLEQEITLPVEFYDERYSTAEATDLLIEMGYSPQQRKKIIDKMAASIILKNFLEDRK
ncbi:MAG: Holliday junction resolvase RuvX [Candidatus Cloacimonadales bacterium]